MAFTLRIVFFAASHLLFLLHLFIHGSESSPLSPPVHSNCPLHDGFDLLRFPVTDAAGPVCGDCNATCNHGNPSVINCTSIQGVPGQVLSILPSSNTVVIKFLDEPSVDELKKNPCEVYKVVDTTFPISKPVNLTFLGESDTFIRCPSSISWIDEYNTTCLYGSSVLYGPYPPDKFHSITIPAGCVHFKMLSSDNEFYVQYNMSTCQHFQIYLAAEGAGCYADGDDDSKETPAPAPAPHSGNSDGTPVPWKLLLIIICSVLAAVLILLAVYWSQRKNKQGLTTSSSRTKSLNRMRSYYPETGNINGVTVFSYTELQEATNNFDDTKELGEGGFGIVYHGKLRDGREVAVKRMYEKNYTQIEQFKNEIRILTSLRHPNLVTLYGCTSRHSRELLLVYEYVPNKTVADHLHGDKANSALLLWPARMSIAVQTATALSYLHFNEVIHRDIKTDNILLDHSFRAKVADFGLSRLFPADVSHVSTAPQGTPGYVDPEYHQCYHLTDRSDVYSFGVVLIELISSLPAIDIGRHRHEVNLANYAMNIIQCSTFGELVDPNLGFERDFKVRRMTTLVAELAFRCLQEERELRPSMEEVLEELKRLQSVDYDALEAEEIGYENHHST